MSERVHISNPPFFFSLPLAATTTATWIFLSDKLDYWID